jgi:SynChlorMet cassette radical SAM/SPASM protein ScmF
MKEETNTYRKNKVGSEEYPLNQLYFYLTEGCNLACRHCWLAPKFDPDGSKHAMLPQELFTQAIEEAIPLGLTGVKLTGGEPMLHPDFLAMLDFLQEKKLELTLETNGILLTPGIARAIAQQNNPFVSVSLDGSDAATHDKIRGVKGAFAKSTAAIRILAENDLNPQVIMSIMRSNTDQLEEVIGLAEQLGAGSVKFNIIQPTGRGETIFNDSNGLQVKELIELGRRIETETVLQTDMELYFDYPAAFRPLSRIASSDGCGTCGILSILGVLPSGEYALCGIGSHVKELVFGKVRDDSLADTWLNNPVLLQLRNGLPEKLTGICSHCLMKSYCSGSCIAQNYYRTGSLWAPFWFCKKGYDLGLFPDSRLDFTLNGR